MTSSPEKSPSSMSGPLHGETRLSEDALAEAAGINHLMLVHLIGLGIIEPASPGETEFTATTAARLRRMLRIAGDLDLDPLAAAIIVDLMDRLDRLEAEITGLRRGRT